MVNQQLKRSDSPPVLKHRLIQFLLFGYHQAMSCLFPVIIFATLAISKWIDFLPRYDFILLVLVVVQIAMVMSGLESIDELKVICMFHLIGLAMEIYKVHMGSWSYPEFAYSKLAGVPLYSGFMYASVASFMCQIWRRLKMDLTGWPNPIMAMTLGAAIYFNFFTHHYIFDFRWYLTIAVFIVFLRTKIYYTVRKTTYTMPLTIAFLLVGFFVWLAENIATFFGAWNYPNQQDVWRMVGIGKLSSWFLLAIISVIIVAQLKVIKANRAKKE